MIFSTAPNQKANNQKGQALIESLVVLPVYILLISGCLAGAYLAMVVQWTDYWTYRANICHIEGANSHHCRDHLIKRLNLIIPNQHFEVTALWKTAHRAQCSVDIDFGTLLQRTLTSRVPLPLQ